MTDIGLGILQGDKILATVLALVGVLGITWLLSNAIAADALHGMILLAGGLMIITAIGKTAGDWRSGVYLFFVWLLFEDLVRKYLGNSMFVYFGKDVLIGATYIAFLISRSRGSVVLAWTERQSQQI